MVFVTLAILVGSLVLAMIMGLYSWNKPASIRVRVDEIIYPNRPR
jgi:hypothetical protein